MLNKFGKNKDEAEDFIQNYLWGFENFAKYFESLKAEEREGGVFFTCVFTSQKLLRKNV